MADAHIEAPRVARKAHRCFICGKLIAPKTSYLETSGIWEGEPFRQRSHHACVALYRTCQDVTNLDWEDMPDTAGEIAQLLVEYTSEAEALELIVKELGEHATPDEVVRAQAMLTGTEP